MNTYCIQARVHTYTIALICHILHTEKALLRHTHTRKGDTHTRKGDTHRHVHTHMNAHTRMYSTYLNTHIRTYKHSHHPMSLTLIGIHTHTHAAHKMTCSHTPTKYQGPIDVLHVMSFLLHATVKWAVCRKLRN